MPAEVPCSSVNMHCKASSKLLKKTTKTPTCKVNELFIKSCSSHPHAYIKEDNWDCCIYCYIFATIVLFV